MLPDRKRPALAPPARALAASLAHFAAAAAWRTLHPAARESYVESAAPRPLVRLYYDTADGWRAPLLHLPAAPGGAGEPVVLLHALGFHADAFRYGQDDTLASALSDAGFSVYLLLHRGDRDATPPTRSTGFCFDDIVEHDLPAAFERVRVHAGFPQVHLVGHGLGGQLALACAGRGAEALATVTALCAAVRFLSPRSEATALTRIAAFLPSHWQLPARALGPVFAPWVDRELLDHTAGATPGDRLRGVMHHAVADVPVGLVRQIGVWLRHGALVDRHGLLDYGEALVDARIPLLLGVAGGDRVCPPGSATPAYDRWGGERELLVLPDSYGHLDVLLGRDAHAHVFLPIVAWLTERRRLAWQGQGADLSVLPSDKVG